MVDVTDYFTKHPDAWSLITHVNGKPINKSKKIDSTLEYLRGMGIRHTNDMARALQERGFSEKETFAAVNRAFGKGILRRDENDVSKLQRKLNRSGY